MQLKTESSISAYYRLLLISAVLTFAFFFIIPLSAHAKTEYLKLNKVKYSLMENINLEILIPSEKVSNYELFLISEETGTKTQQYYRDIEHPTQKESTLGSFSTYIEEPGVYYYEVRTYLGNESRLYQSESFKVTSKGPKLRIDKFIVQLGNAKTQQHEQFHPYTLTLGGVANLNMNNIGNRVSVTCSQDTLLFMSSYEILPPITCNRRSKIIFNFSGYFENELIYLDADSMNKNTLVKLEYSLVKERGAALSKKVRKVLLSTEHLEY